jgi:hypothetical protein
MSSSVLRETFKVSFSLTRQIKSSQFVCFLLRLGCFSLFCATAVSVIKTGEWSEDRSKHDFGTAKFWRIPSVTQKSTESGSLFLSVGQYVGSPVDRCFKLLLSSVLSSSRHLGVIILDPQSVCFAL